MNPMSIGASGHPPAERGGRTIVVGAGIAGLVCATELERAGQRVLLLEREAVVGGRVRSELRDGFRIDRGFQVLFTAYPVLGAYLDQTALELRRFEPAARIALPTGTATIGDAIRDPSLLPALIRASHVGVGVGDLWRLLRLRRLATRLSVEECFASRYADVSTSAFLRQRGFTAQAVGRFFAPFYGGILLDRQLESSASVLLFTFKMLASGDIALPASGMGAITKQLASRLRVAELRTSAEVTAILAEGGRAAGVVLSDGSVERADDIVLATDAPASARLAAAIGVRLTLPSHGRGCTTLYLASREPLLPGAALTLNATPNATISHAITLTDVAPEYGPRGAHLIAMTAVGDSAEVDDALLTSRAIAELAMMRHARIVEVPDVVAIVRVPYAQFSHPPGYHRHRAEPATPLPGLWLGSEVLHSSSLDGAARGGREAAKAVASSVRTT